MRLPMMAVVFTASTVMSMASSARWVCDKVLHGVDTLYGHYSASEAIDDKFVIAGKSVRAMAMTSSVSAAVMALAELSPCEDNRRIIEKRLERSNVGRLTDALATASVGKNWLGSSNVRELVDNVVNVSSCPTETSTSKRSTCGMGLSSCMEDCDGGLWFKPVPGACYLVCTMAEEYCSRCKKQRAADELSAHSAQGSWARAVRSGFIQAYDLDLPQHFWLYALSMVLAIAGLVYQSANHARQLRRISGDVDREIASVKDEIRNASSTTDECKEVQGDEGEQEGNGDREQPDG